MGQPQQNQGNSSKQKGQQNDAQARDARKELGQQNRQKAGQKDEPQNGEKSPQGQDPTQRGGSQGEGSTEPPKREDDTPPWFAALPPEIRDAIDAGRGEEIPARYQELVRRYNLYLQEKAKRRGR